MSFLERFKMPQRENSALFKWLLCLFTYSNLNTLFYEQEPNTYCLLSTMKLRIQDNIFMVVLNFGRIKYLKTLYRYSHTTNRACRDMNMHVIGILIRWYNFLKVCGKREQTIEWMTTSMHEWFSESRVNFKLHCSGGFSIYRFIVPKREPFVLRLLCTCFVLRWRLQLHLNGEPLLSPTKLDHRMRR